MVGSIRGIAAREGQRVVSDGTPVVLLAPTDVEGGAQSEGVGVPGVSAGQCPVSSLVNRTCRAVTASAEVNRQWPARSTVVCPTRSP